ncbi:CHAT domain-containing tetratricopeptide repeat protein [Sorangium cellulosum]|uniref:CHAT domain-containing tetratricopeptide repeat protein n=1 Tax=Sorangium cellulosum TaxID=56 RepID=UPI001331A68B|nr:CHAT domain-containing tetratricopeptide repeat protein [Sorangium cellulosum]
MGLAVLLAAPGCTKQGTIEGSTQVILYSASAAVGAIIGSTMGLRKSTPEREARWRAPEPPAPVLAAVRRLNAQVLERYERGSVDDAIPLAREALALLEDAVGRWHRLSAAAINTLAVLYSAKGDYARAEPLFKEAISIREFELGQGHPEVATSLAHLARVYSAKSDYTRATPLLARALEIREEALGREHPDVAASLDDIAELYVKKGDYARAEPLHGRALAIREKALGRDHLDVAVSLNNIAMLHHATGDDAAAERMLDRVLDIRERALDRWHPRVAESLNNLAMLRHARGDDAPAERMLDRALAIREKALGPDHPDVAESLNNLALLRHAKGDDAPAERMLDRALVIREEALGPDHPDVAASLGNLALLHHARGDYAPAERLFGRALAIREKALGPDHPDVAASLQNSAILRQAQGDTPGATRRMTLAAAIEERNAAVFLTIGADEQKRASMAALQRSTEAAVSLHVHFAPDDEAAKRLAVILIVRRKGRVLDAMAYGLAALRRRLSAEDRALLDALSRVSAELSALTWRGPEEPRADKPSPARARLDTYRARLSRLEARRRQLETEVSRRSPEVRAQLSPVPLAQVQAAVPEGAALVELFRYHPVNPGATSIKPQWSKPRYAAYVLRRDGEITWAELGEAERIEGAVHELRSALARPASDPRPPARALDALVMQPIRRLLGPTRRVLLSPDGALNLVPFGALVDEDGRYLVERYAFTYLPSGRDLVRLRAAAPSRQGAVVLAAPDYDAPPAPPQQPSDTGDPPSTIWHQRGRLHIATTQSAEAAPSSEAPGVVRFRPLASAAQEGRIVARQLVAAQVLLGADATEAAFKALHGPRLLHVVTHGFFLPDQKTLHAPPSPPSLDFGSRSFGRPGNVLPEIEDPLLRSGLAFAGANRRSSGSDDGILTALEASQLDLNGTQLVVLAACETGVGDVKSGDGVYGLRRALVMAGAETQVMSLWNVRDDATLELMQAYYQRLLAGGGRGEALRQAQLAMLASPERAHPFYWASFIVSGNDAALGDPHVAPRLPEVRPPHGCGCDLARPPPPGSGAVAAAALLAAFALVRPRRRARRAHPLRLARSGHVTSPARAEPRAGRRKDNGGKPLDAAEEATPDPESP